MGKKVIDVRPPCKRRGGEKKEFRREGVRDKQETKKKGFLFPIMLLLFVVVGYYYYTSYRTEIVVYPKVERLTEDVELLVRTTGSLAENEVRGVILSEVMVESRDFEIEGTKFVEEKTEGEIEVCQTYSQSPVSYIVNTRFISDEGKYFLAKDAFQLPGTSKNNGCVQVPVIAMNPGPDYNIEEKSSFTLPGLVGRATYAQVTGKSFTITKRGVKEEVPDLDDESREAAEQQIMEEILLKGKEELREKYEEEYLLLSDAQFEVDVKRRGFLEPEEDSNKFSYELEVVIEAVAVSKESINEYIGKNILSGSTWREETEVVDVDFIDINFEDGEADIALSFAVDVYDNFDKEEWRREFAGNSFAVIESQIASKIETERVTVRNIPFGLKRAVSNHERVVVKLRFDKN